MGALFLLHCTFRSLYNGTSYDEMELMVGYKSVFRSLACLGGFSVVLLGCQTQEDAAKERIETAKPHVLAEYSDAWGGAVVDLGQEKIIAVARHKDNALALWRLGSDRNVVDLGENFPTGYHPDGVAALGNNRVVVAVEGTREYAIWSVAQPVEISRASTPFPSRDVVVGDFNQDGHLDLVFSPYLGDQLAILWGDGQGYSAPQFIPAGNSPWHPVVYDWNNDGIDDLLWAELDTGSVRVAYGHPVKQINVSRLHQVKGTTARQLAVGDIDGDGRADLLVAVEVGESDLLLTREGGFERIAITPEDGHLGFVSAAILENGIVALADEGRVVLMHYQHTSTPERRYLPAGSLPAPLKVTDLDNDGALDLLVFNSAKGGVNLHFGPLWSVAKNAE